MPHIKEKEKFPQSPSQEPEKYAYIVKAKDKSVWLKIEHEDVCINADGDLDCPVDRVLRKNGYSFYDLMSWTTKEIDFVAITEGVATTIRTIPFNVTF